MWNKDSLHELVLKQREFFLSNKTLPISFRKEQLKKLRNTIVIHQDEIVKALEKDLGRSPEESYLCDIFTSLGEIDDAIKHVKRWAKPETHNAGLTSFPSRRFKIYKLPYGVTLIISPFNFPIFLTFAPLAASLAAGNTVIIKASSKSSNSTAVMKRIIEEIFPSEYVSVINGGHDIADLLLEERFDKIFYTGSPRVGRHIMEEASKNLTPVALELGGENGNWAIVRKDANIKDTARKIAFAKICNSGQICIDINQVGVAKEIADSFINELKNEFKRQIGDFPLKSEEYCHLIDKNAYKRCLDEANKYKDRIIYGGHGDESSLRFEPTLIYPVDLDEDIVKHELFNPLLPIVIFEDDKVHELVKVINEREHSLAMYLFTRDMKWAKNVMSTSQYGGGCINEVILHSTLKNAPFGGVGHSGIGSYHGIYGFREFSHNSTVLFGKTKMNLSLREHPYKNTRKLKIIKKLSK